MKAIVAGCDTILMPFFPLGSIASYQWSTEDTRPLKSCLQMACLALMDAFLNKQVVHGDFHAANILLKKTKLKALDYDAVSVPTYGLRPWIGDFEKSYVHDGSASAFEDFKYDLQKLFFLLPTFLPRISKQKVLRISSYIERTSNVSTLQRDLCSVVDASIEWM